MMQKAGIAKPLQMLTLLTVVFLGDRAGAADKPPRPIWLHINGIGGERRMDHTLIRGLKAGGFDADYEFYDWTHGEDGLTALRNFTQNRKEADKVREMILRFAKERPDRPIYLSSHSGGAGIAVWALEDLPPDVKIESLLMMAPALSPTYDLSKALSHVRGKAYVFSSRYDSVILKTGTRMFGTIDRKFCEAAGLDGFVKPEGADDREYRKLVPQPYRRQWLLQYGNAGTHISAMGYQFSRLYIAPMLKKDLRAGAEPLTPRPVHAGRAAAAGES